VKRSFVGGDEVLSVWGIEVLFVCLFDWAGEVLLVCLFVYFVCLFVREAKSCLGR
jgi:hypothetical protein